MCIDMYRKSEKRVPKLIRLLETVRPDFPLLLEPRNRNMVARSGQCFQCVVNPHGAVAILFPDGELLGVKPNEYEVVEWEAGL